MSNSLEPFTSMYREGVTILVSVGFSMAEAKRISALRCAYAMYRSAFM